MSRALALAALLLAAPAAAQDRATAEVRYTPDPRWFTGPGIGTPVDGAVRIVTAPQGTAALTLEQYWTYERLYRDALARLSFRMPVARAERLARRAALDGVLAHYPVLRATGLRVHPVAGPDLRDVPVR